MARDRGELLKVDTPYLPNRSALYFYQNLLYAELLAVADCLKPSGDVDPHKVPQILIALARDADGQLVFKENDATMIAQELFADEVLGLVEQLTPVFDSALKKP